MGHMEHKSSAPDNLNFVVITVTDTRTEDEDKGGEAVIENILEAGHILHDRYLVKDDHDEIRDLVTDLLNVEEVDLVILTGGSGIARRDVTVESLEPLIEKKIDGFGELFRYLSYLDIGSSAILSRAMAGVARGKVIVSLPGSVKAVRLAMEKLILPEAGHMILEARK